MLTIVSLSSASALNMRPRCVQETAVSGLSLGEILMDTDKINSSPAATCEEAWPALSSRSSGSGLGEDDTV